LAILVVVAAAAATGCSGGEQGVKPAAGRAAVQSQLDAVRRVRDAVAAGAPDLTLARHLAAATEAGGRARQLNQARPGLEVIRTLEAAVDAYVDARAEREASRLVAQAVAEVPGAPGDLSPPPSAQPAALTRNGDESLRKAEAELAAWK
jgi:hypothetical protein